jgi:succinate dehydrogenase / fumarate reductase iron-sulfur subunit
MRIIIFIRRFDPDSGAPPFSQPFELEVESTERLLDALLRIVRTKDPTLALRKSCGHGVCGSDAMLVNGRERLACKTLIKDVADKDGDVIVVEPLRNLPVRKDLCVDFEPFFDRFRAVMPYFMAGEGSLEEEKERLQTPEERRAFEEATRCILCAACRSACPVVGAGKPFLGPAAVVQAFRFNEDSRDRGFEARLPALDRPDGAWPCDNKLACTRVCPRVIPVTKSINETKRKITHHRMRRGETVNDK